MRIGLAFLTKEAAAALKEAIDNLVFRGYRLKIFDAYRPQMAVTHFMNWALDPDDVRMKEYFYPELEKDTLFPQGYIAEHSGHSRGSTVDLTFESTYCSINISQCEMTPASIGGVQQTSLSGGYQMNPGNRMKREQIILTAKNRRKLW